MPASAAQTELGRRERSRLSALERVQRAGFQVGDAPPRGPELGVPRDQQVPQAQDLLLLARRAPARRSTLRSLSPARIAVVDLAGHRMQPDPGIGTADGLRHVASHRQSSSAMRGASRLKIQTPKHADADEDRRSAGSSSSRRRPRRQRSGRGFEHPDPHLLEDRRQRVEHEGLLVLGRDRSQSGRGSASRRTAPGRAPSR